MEEKLKQIITIALEAKLGYAVEITPDEWEAARVDTLNDIFYNKLCSLREPTLNYFFNTMVSLLAIMKRIAA